MLEFYYIERGLLKAVNNLYLIVLLEQKTKEVAIILNNMWVLSLYLNHIHAGSLDELIVAPMKKGASRSFNIGTVSFPFINA